MDGNHAFSRALSRFLFLDEAAEGAGMVAIKGFREGLKDGSALGVIAHHVDPGHRLQKKPLPPGDPKGQC